MNTTKWVPVALAGALFAMAVFATPAIRNLLFLPTVADESLFPTTAANTRGALIVGTDGGTRLYLSPGDAGSWDQVRTFQTAGDNHLSAFFPGSVLAAGDVIIQSRFTAPTTFTRLSVTITAAGSDGAHNFTVDVFDLTTSSVVCVTGNIACNATGNAGVACTGTVALADDVQLRVNDSACTVTAPTLNVAAEYR